LNWQLRSRAGSSGGLDAYRITTRRRFARKLTSEEMDDVINGSAAVYLYGEVRYRDAFDQPRFTKYRMFCNGDALSLDRFSPYVDGDESN
jgi:hypothetical protein